MQYKSFMEALKGKQHKLDKNKNGKLDAHDFKLLRKEESDLTEATVETKKYSWGTMKTVHHGKDFSVPLHPEHHQVIAKLKDEQEHKFKDETGRHWTARRKGDDVHLNSGNDGPKTVVKHAALKEETVEEAADRMARSDYKVSPSGRKTHKEITFPTSDKDDEKKEMKEEIEELDERNKENATRRKMMDASRGARFKAQGNYTPDPEPEHKTAQAHNKAVGRAIRKMSNEEIDLDEASNFIKGVKRFMAGKKNPSDVRDAHLAKSAFSSDSKVKEKEDRRYDKVQSVLSKEEVESKKKDDDLPFTPDPVKKNPIAKAGKFGIGPSTAKHLAKMGMQQAMKKTVKEETDDSEKIEMAQTQLHFMKYAAMEILEYIEMGGEVEEWYQNKLSKVQSDMESLHSYIEGEKRRTGMVKEEIEEGMQQTLRKYVPGYAKHQLNKKMDAQAYEKGDSIKKTVDKDVNYARYKKIADKLNKEEVEIEEQAPVAPVPDKKYIKGTPEHKAYMATKKTRVGHPTNVKEDLDEKIDLGKAKMGDVIKDFQASDAPQFAGKSKEKRREMAIAAKLEADRGTRKEETEMLSYKDFMMMLEYEAKSGVYRHTGTYGSEYAKKEREQDEKGFDSEKQSTEKRGRGRPAGAKSGARGPRIK